MKIMKVVDKKVGDIVYYKYRVNLPKSLVEDLDFSEKEIKIRRDKDRIVIEKRLES